MLVMMVIMLIKCHYIEVGVGVLPNERVEDVILDCDLQWMELMMMKAVVTE